MSERKYRPPSLRNRSSGEAAPDSSSASSSSTSTPAPAASSAGGFGSGRGGRAPRRGDGRRRDGRRDPGVGGGNAPHGRANSWRRGAGGSGRDEQRAQAGRGGQQRKFEFSRRRQQAGSRGANNANNANNANSASDSQREHPQPHPMSRSSSASWSDYAGPAGSSSSNATTEEWSAALARLDGAHEQRMSDPDAAVAGALAALGDLREKFTFPLPELGEVPALDMLVKVLRLGEWEGFLDSGLSPERSADDLANERMIRFSQVLSALVMRQRVRMVGPLLERAVRLLLDRMCGRASGWALVDVLRVVSHCVLERGAEMTDELVSELLNVVIPVARSSAQLDAEKRPDMRYQLVEARRMALTCLGNLFVKTRQRYQSHMKSVVSVILLNFHKFVEEAKTDGRFVKILFASLRALTSVLSEADVNSLHEYDFVAILDCIKKGIAWGHGRHRGPPARKGAGAGAMAGDSALASTSSAQQEQERANSNALLVSSRFNEEVRREAHSFSPFYRPGVFAAKPLSLAPASSSSSSRSSASAASAAATAGVAVDGRGGAESEESSDSTAGSAWGSSASLRGRDPSLAGVAYASAVKVRLFAVHVLQRVAELVPKVVHKQWLPFLPSDVKSGLSMQPAGGPNLVTILVYDPSPKVRNAAACALLQMLHDTPFTKWVGTLHRGGKRSAFTSMSERFGNVILALHAGLHLALQRETSTPSHAICVQLLQCLNVLVTNTPYQNMPSTAKGEEVLWPLVDHLMRAYLMEMSRHTLTIRREVYVCLTTIFDMTVPLPELEARLMLPDDQLLELLITQANQRTKGHPTPDSLTVLSKVAQKYPGVLARHWRIDEADNNQASLARLVQRAFRSNADHDCAVLTIKVIEDWVRDDVPAINRQDQPLTSSRTTLFTLPGALHMFVENMPGLYYALPRVRPKILSCMAYIPEPLWAEYSSSERSIIFGLYKAGMRDDGAPTRTAAARALGLLGVYHTVRSEHHKFFTSAVAQLVRMADIRCEPSLAVRIRACWSIANVCDLSIVTAPPSPSASALEAIEVAHRVPRMKEAVGDELHAEILHMLMHCVDNDNEKVVANAMRALGNLGRWMSPVGPEQWQAICTTLEGGLHHGKPVKSQWNVCYAIANVLHNHDQAPQASFEGLFRALVRVVEHSTNFKVRINAVVALMVPSTRTCFGDMFVPVLIFVTNMLLRLDDEELQSFSEYRYRDSLKTHLVACVCRLVRLVDADGENALELLAQHAGAGTDQALQDFVRHLSPSSVQGVRVTHEDIEELQTLLGITKRSFGDGDV